MKLNQNEVILHGEAMIFPNQIPSDAQEVEIKTGEKSFIIADSETTGNHHVIDLEPGTKFFRSGERLFMKNEKPTRVRCVHPSRHNAIAIEPGVYEVGENQMEYDHFAQNLTKVRD
jgi:hypothetical protein